MNPIYPWKRFWCHRSGRVSLSDEGFLSDPDGKYAKYFQKEVVAFDEIQHYSCLILLGEPGIGKTTAIKAEFQNMVEHTDNTTVNALYFNLNEYGSEDRLISDVFKSDVFTLWKSDGGTLHLFLDSLDECRIKIQNVGPLIISQLEKVSHCLGRLRLRIACRTADWPNVLEAGLSKLWSDGNNDSDHVGICELVPLRCQDVHLAAEVNQIDANKFIQDVLVRDVVSLAIKPLTLKFLLSTYKAISELPQSKLELYATGCRYLCEEHNPYRQDLVTAGKIEGLSANQHIGLASRMAAISILCRKPVFITNPSCFPVSEEIFVGDISINHEIFESERIEASKNNIQKTLGTGLFSSRGAYQLGFAHQSYAEYLAAIYVNSNFNLGQIKSIFFHSGESETKIVPQLYETAAWLASLNKDFLREVVASDPQVLLKADASCLSNEDRCFLAESLLTLLRHGQINTRQHELYHQYHKLNCPQLADILRPYISGQKTDGLNVRNLAIDIAETCKMVELQELLADIALDQSEPIRIRDGATHAVWLIGTSSTKKRFLPLASGQGGDDPDDNLKGYALRSLWPELISASEIFGFLTPPKRKTFFGSYQGFLTDELVQNMNPVDLPVALMWAEEMVISRKTSQTILDVIKNIIILAWKNLSRPEIPVRLSRVFINILCHYSKIVFDLKGASEASESLFSDTVKRHSILETIVETCCVFDKIKYKLHWDPPQILRVNDMAWLLQRLAESKSDEIKSRWSILIHNVFNCTSCGHLDMVLNARKESPHLEQQFRTWFEPVSLGSDQARQMKEDYEEHKRREKEREENEQPQTLEWLPKDRIEHWLKKCEEGDVKAWHELCVDLTLEDTTRQYENCSDLDITNLPGWKNSDEGTRNRILACATQYLTHQHADPLIWIRAPHEYCVADLSPFKAFNMLHKYSTDLLEALPINTWKKWIPSLLGVPFYGNNREEDQNYEVLSKAYMLCPEEFIFWLNIQINAENKEGRLLSVHERLKKCWDAQLCESVLAIIKGTYIIPEFFSKLLAQLIKQSYEEAVKYAEGLIFNLSEYDQDSINQFIQAAVVLLKYSGDGGWNAIWPRIQIDCDFGRQVFMAAGIRFHREGEELFDKLDKESIADLYIWLEQQFPYAEDPQHNGVYAVGQRESISHFRDNLYRFLEHSGSVSALRKIFQAFPEYDWLKSVIVEAQKNMMQMMWMPIEPIHLLKMARSPQFKLVQNATHLQSLILESLQQLEERLQGETPAAPDLWDQTNRTKGQEKFCPKDENHFSDYLKRYLDHDLRERGVIINREVEIRRGEGGGQGENTDIYVSAVIRKNHEIYDVARVIIEVKCCWNQELQTAMKTQLVDRYLKDNDCQTGIYAVGWFMCPQLDKRRYQYQKTPKWTIDQAQTFFNKQADSLSDETQKIKAIVINAALR